MRRVVPTMLIVPFLLPAVPLAAQQSFTLSGDRVAVYNLAGKVTLTAGSGSSVVVTATPGGAEGGGLRFEQGDLRGRTAFRVLYPADDILYRGLEGNSRTELQVADDGTFGDGRGRSGGRRVRIAGDRGTDAHADLAIAVPAGRSVEVFLAIGSVTATNVKGDLALDVAAAGVKVSGHRGRLSVDAGSGNVEISGGEGELSVETGSGNVRLTDVTSPGGILLEAGSGNITGNGLRAGSVHAEAGSGNIELSAVQATDFDVETGSGNVRLDLASDPGDVSVETGSGDVELRLPANAGAAVAFETGSGDVRSEFTLQVTRTGRDELRGTMGDGRGRLEVETGSGDVSLLKR